MYASYVYASSVYASSVMLERDSESVLLVESSVLEHEYEIDLLMHNVCTYIHTLFSTTHSHPYCHTYTLFIRIVDHKLVQIVARNAYSMSVYCNCREEWLKCKHSSCPIVFITLSNFLYLCSNLLANKPS